MDLSSIETARERLTPFLRPTPLVFSHAFSRAPERGVWLKLETQQPTGSFKVRPALNGALVHLEEARQAGVLASSSGNFAQGVAWAARELGLRATIVMMRSSSPYKIALTEALGAQVVLCGNTFEERWETTFRLQRETGRVLLHPYDSEETIAGDGALGLELLEQMEDDFTVVVPVSGGGLLAGIAVAVKRRRPRCKVVAVQPEANASLARSLEAGERVHVGVVKTLADALVASTLGERTFRIAQELVDQTILVSEEEIAGAVRELALRQKIVAEPGGAVGVAALLAGRVASQTRNVVCVISGGNVMPETLAGLLSGGPGR
jgi:threonine dehydratase